MAYIVFTHKFWTSSYIAFPVGFIAGYVSQHKDVTVIEGPQGRETVLTSHIHVFGD